MPSTPTIDTRTQVLLEEIAKLLAQGLALEHVAIQADMDEATVSRLIAHDAFPAVFKSLAPGAYERWHEAKEADIAQRRVKAMAQEDAPEHYRMLRAIVREEGHKFHAVERARVLESLIKMSGVIKEDSTVEVVELSPGQLDNIGQTDREVEEFLAEYEGNANRR